MQNKLAKTQNLFLILLTWLSFGLVFVLGKFALSYSSPLQFLILRMFIGGLVLIFLSSNKIANFKKGLKNKILFFKVTLFHIYLAFVFEYWALSYVDALRASLLYSLSPFVTALLSFLIFKEQFGLRKFSGLTMGFLSCLGLMSANIFTAKFNLLRTNFFDLILLISIFSSSYAWFEIKKLTSKKIDLVFINGTSMLLGSALCFVTKMIFEPNVLLLPNLDNLVSLSKFSLALAGTIIFANFIGYNLYGYLFEKIGPTKISLTGFLCPFFVLIFSCLFNLNFEFTLMHLASLTLGILGLYIFESEKYI